MNIEQSSTTTGLCDPLVDAELQEILEGYLVALEQGDSPGREDLLAKHPQHAELLGQYLPFVELLHQAKPGDSGSTANPPMPGRLGDFRLLREIGRGGMGIVYEAEQLALERRVAVKVLPFASMLDERQLARFKNEALAAAHLHHPNIVPIFAVGCERGLHFHAMQVIDGETLEQLFSRPRPEAARLPAQDAEGLDPGRIEAASRPSLARLRDFATWIAQAADALDHAHCQGVVHRDVKPSNLMVARDGNLWVTDFGLARTGRDAGMTATGELLGTLRYMSPEQLRSKPGIVDHRTDIYSLGLTLFELIAQRPGFDGRSQRELIKQIEEDELPSLVRLDRRVPRDLDSIVGKATAKAPEARYASARELADDLRAFLDGRSTVARPQTIWDRGQRWIRRHAQLAAAVGMGLVLIAICAMASAIVVWRAHGETQHALTLASENHRRAEENLRDARDAVDDVFTGMAASLSNIPGAEGLRGHLLKQALGYYQKFIIQASEDEAVRGETAAAYYRCGQINEQFGDDAAACEAFLEAQKLWLALAHQTGIDQSRNLSLCENNIGLILLRAGQTGPAETHLRESLALASQRADSAPDNADAQHALGLAYANLGMAQGLARRIDDARTSVETALVLQTRAGATSAPLRGDLATTYNQLGYLCSAHSVTDAEDAYRHAAQEFESLVTDEPNVLRWQSELATTLNNLAALGVRSGRADEAKQLYDRAIAIERSLVARAPQIVAYARDLAVTQNNFGYLLSQHDQPQAAIEQFENARTGLSRLAVAHEQSPEYASRLGAVCNNLGLACETLGCREDAETAFSNAVEWQEKALALSPDWSQARAYLDTHLANLRRARLATERPRVESSAGDAKGHVPAPVEPLSAARGIIELPREGLSPARPSNLAAATATGSIPHLTE